MAKCNLKFYVTPALIRLLTLDKHLTMTRTLTHTLTMVLALTLTSRALSFSYNPLSCFHYILLQQLRQFT